MGQLNALYVLDAAAHALAYGPDERQALAGLVNVFAPPQTARSVVESPDLLARADVLLTGWGGPLLDEAFLDAAPRLKAVFHAAGAMGSMLTPAVWDRGVVATSATAANARPVAEYTLAAILFSLKHGWALARQTRRERRFPPRDGAPGCYGSTVGLVSLGVVARALLRLLPPFDLRVLAYDPYLGEAEARELGVERVSLEELFRRADVVSVHTPLFAETAGLIRGAHVRAMRPGATFINTARGLVVCESELLDVLAERPDLQAVLDTVCEEPPAQDSPLYTLPNVVLTPHIAGSVGQECRRMGKAMVAELRRYVAGEPLLWAITPDLAARTSHRPSLARAAFTVSSPARPAPEPLGSGAAARAGA